MKLHQRIARGGVSEVIALLLFAALVPVFAQVIVPLIALTTDGPAKFGPRQPAPAAANYALVMQNERKPDDATLHVETDNPTYADDHNFYKVEKWTRDGTKVDRLLYAGNSLAKAQEIFAKSIMHRPRIRLTIRQRTRVLQQWPA
jgi:hypothetical protein